MDMICVSFKYTDKWADYIQMKNKCNKSEGNLQLHLE